MGSKELKKGYFPHLFNKKENENYVSPIPPAPYYNPNGMNPKDKEAFMIWHASKRESNDVFNFHEEIIVYCRSDVDILRRCCLEFRELFYNVTDIDPFTTLTIASACHLVYRTNYLPKLRYDRYHSAYGIYLQEETVLVCAQMAIVYGREARNPYSTCTQRRRETRRRLFSRRLSRRNSYRVRSPGLFLARLPEMLRS